MFQDRRDRRGDVPVLAARNVGRRRSYIFNQYDVTNPEMRNPAHSGLQLHVLGNST